jgi:hypothetical protein
MRKTLIATAIMIALSSSSLYAQTQAASSNLDKTGKNRAANAAQSKMNTTSQGVNSTGATTQIQAPIDQSATTTATQQTGNPGNLGNSQGFSDTNTTPTRRAGSTAPATGSTATGGTSTMGTSSSGMTSSGTTSSGMTSSGTTSSGTTSTGSENMQQSTTAGAGATGAMMDDTSTTTTAATTTTKPKHKAKKSKKHSAK